MPDPTLVMHEFRSLTAGPSGSIANGASWDADLAPKLFDATLISLFVRISAAGNFDVELWQDSARTNAVRFRQQMITDAQFVTTERVPVHMSEGNLYLRLINNSGAARTFEAVELLLEAAK